MGWSLLGRLPLGMTPLRAPAARARRGRRLRRGGLVVAVVLDRARHRRPDARPSGRPARARLRCCAYGAVGYAALLGLVVVLAAVDAGTCRHRASPRRSRASSIRRYRRPCGSSGRGIAPGDLRSTAYAFEAAMQEVFFVVGPLLAAGARRRSSPLVAVAGAGAREPRRHDRRRAARARPRDAAVTQRRAPALLGALGSPGVRTVVLYAAVVGVAFGAVELAMPAFAEAARRARARRDRTRVLRGGQPRRRPRRGMRPPRDDVRRFIVGAVGSCRALLGAPARCLAADARAARVRRRPADRPDRGGALLLDRPQCADRNRGRGVRVVRDGGLDRVRGRRGSGGRLVEERGVRWAFGFGAAVALGGASSAGCAAARSTSERPSTLTGRP